MRRALLGLAFVAGLLFAAAPAASASPSPLTGVLNLTNGVCYRIIPTKAGYGNIAYNGSQHAFLTVTGGAYTLLCTDKVATNTWQIVDPQSGRCAGYYNSGPLGSDLVTEQNCGPGTWQQWFITNDGGGKFDIYNNWVTENRPNDCIDSNGQPSDQDLNAINAGQQISMICQNVPIGVFFEWFFYLP